MVNWATQLARLKTLGETETLVYKPENRPKRSIDCLVDRPGPAETPAGSAARQEILVTALNDQVNGIDPATLNCNADRITVAGRLGADGVDRRILRVVSQDKDFVTVAV